MPFLISRMAHSPKLTLFFNNDEGAPRLDDSTARKNLDSESAPGLDDDGNPMWVIGRGSHADIGFTSIKVSRRQAYIRCWALETRQVWQIKHEFNACNPSFKDNRDGVIRLPDQWLNIHDYDQFFFAKPEYGFVCTTSPNDTMQAELDPDEGPPTINETMEAAIAETKAATLEIDNMWEALYHMLADIPNSRLMIYGGFALIGLAAWLGAEVLKHLND